MISTGRIEISKDRLLGDLKKIGVAKGDHLAVALSFKSIGYVSGGPITFIDALLEAVGSEGTIMMNAFTLSFATSAIPSDYIFDVATTPPYTGLVPRTLFMRQGSIRSRHPVCSVLAIGKMAKYLTAGHDEKSRPFLPYEKLAEIRGKYLAVGIGDRLVGIRHEAQRRAGLFVVPLCQSAKFKNIDGEIKLFTYVGPPCVRNLHELVPKLESTGVIKRGKIGVARSIIGPADKIIDSMTAMLREKPTLNLCDDLFCYKCRELERRMDLYKRIANPKLFQRNALIIKVLGLRNSLLLRKLNTSDPMMEPVWIKKSLGIAALFQKLLSKLMKKKKLTSRSKG